MELIIKNPTNEEFIKKINWNFEELKEEIKNKVEIYNNFVYSAENLKAAKSDRAKLNKLKTAINEKRKEIKKLCLKPYENFESEVKEILIILDEPISQIDKQIKAEEEREKKQKRAKLEVYYIENYGDGIGKQIKLEKIFNDKWLNKSYSLKKAQEEIDEKAKEINENIETLNELPMFAFEAKEKYLQTLDIKYALNFVNELTKLQKQKEEDFKKIEEQQKQETEKEQHVIKQGPKQEVKQEPIKRQWINFSAYLSLEEAKALNKFLKENNIQIKRI